MGRLTLWPGSKPQAASPQSPAFHGTAFHMGTCGYALATKRVAAVCP